MLHRMYTMWANKQGFKHSELDRQDGDTAGIKSVTLEIQGSFVYGLLKGENGVHRLVRVRPYNSQGKRMTSFCSVFVHPMIDESIEIDINPADLQWDTYRASGAGGQHVNTTDSAVRITHIPTGVIVTCQDERSQHKNKAKAMKILRARIYEAERQRKEDERAASRKGQVGTGDRSERIRTYNFPQGRVSDHRINLTLYKILQIVEGEALDELIDPLISNDQATRLADAID
jgi:protein subunit release factor A